MNYQTELKIKNIKEAIKNKENLKEIDKKYFGSNKKKKDFFTKNKEHFTSDELVYLEFSEDKEKEEVKTVENKEIEETNELNNQLTKSEASFFKDSDNIKALIEIVQKYRSRSENMEIIENGIITIPAEAKLKLDRNMAVKVNGELYDKIVEMSYKNKVGKGELVTYILWEFYKKHN
mgnify:CR=1 FL=1